MKYLEDTAGDVIPGFIRAILKYLENTAEEVIPGLEIPGIVDRYGNECGVKRTSADLNSSSAWASDQPPGALVLCLPAAEECHFQATA